MDFLSLWQRLQLIGIYADGIFCSGAITSTKQERVLLNRIINSNPDLFEVLYADKTKIYKMTFVFYTKFGLEAPKIVFRKPNSQEIIRAVLWASFISQHNLRENSPNQGIIWGVKMLALDSFSGQFPKKVTAIVTSFEGSARVMQSGYEPIIPEQCLSKWVRKILYKLYLDLNPQSKEVREKEIEVNGKAYKVSSSSFIEGGIWPDKREDCHTDARKYDGIDKPIEGPVKWNRDKLILGLVAKEPDKYAHYKFGVYPKESLGAN